LRLPARTVIFNQGDFGEKMYVIVKGRVAVEKKSPETNWFPRVVALLKDGDHFGELGLIDQEKLDKTGSMGDFNTISSDTLKDGVKQKTKYAPRKAACITTEDTDLLVLSQEMGTGLYQKTEKEAQRKNKVSQLSSNSTISKDGLNLNI